jgi:hypothetical protein
VLLLAVVTLLALEGGEVVILRTKAKGGVVHETRTWIVDDADGAWIEAASPTRPFLWDVVANSQVEVWRDARWQRCHAMVAANPAGHERVRRLLARKYGWKDRWIGLLADTSESIGLRISCEQA